MGDIEYRDPLRLEEVHGDDILVRSARQIIDFNAQNGVPRWKFFDPDASIHDFVVHNGGVWCALDYGQHFINLSLADGSTTCTYSNQGVMQSKCVGKLYRLACSDTQSTRAGARRARGDDGGFAHPV